MNNELCVSEDVKNSLLCDRRSKNNKFFDYLSFKKVTQTDLFALKLSAFKPIGRMGTIIGLK